MSKFVTKPIPAITDVKQYEELVILPDQTDLSKIDLKKVVGVWEEYENSLEGRYLSSFRSLTATMARDARLELIAKVKFRDITPHGEKVKEFEMKHQDLRVYAIHIPGGKLIILGGYKNKQDKDYKRFRSLKAQYLNSLTNDTGRTSKK